MRPLRELGPKLLLLLGLTLTLSACELLDHFRLQMVHCDRYATLAAVGGEWVIKADGERDRCQKSADNGDFRLGPSKRLRVEVGPDEGKRSRTLTLVSVDGQTPASDLVTSPRRSEVFSLSSSDWPASNCSRMAPLNLINDSRSPSCARLSSSSFNCSAEPSDNCFAISSIVPLSGV